MGTEHHNLSAHRTRSFSSIAATLALTLLVPSCASMHWVRPNTSGDQANLDETQCRNAAVSETNLYPYPAPAYGPAWRNNYGYAPSGPDPLKRSELENFCMRSRGYALAPVDQAERRAAVGGSPR